MLNPSLNSVRSVPCVMATTIFRDSFEESERYIFQIPESILHHSFQIAELHLACNLYNSCEADTNEDHTSLSQSIIELLNGSNIDDGRDQFHTLSFAEQISDHVYEASLTCAKDLGLCIYSDMECLNGIYDELLKPYDIKKSELIPSNSKLTQVYKTFIKYIEACDAPEHKRESVLALIIADLEQSKTF